MVSPYVRSVLRDVVSGLSSVLARWCRCCHMPPRRTLFAARRKLPDHKIGAMARSFNAFTLRKVR